MARVVLLVAIVACSGAKRVPVREDAARAVGSGSGSGTGSGRGTGTGTGMGDARIRVEWANVPVVARSSPGMSACGTPRVPDVAPTTTWGVPDAIVVLDGVPPAPGEARIAIARCTFAPIAAIGASLAIASETLGTLEVGLAKRGDVAHLDAVADGERRTVQLPVVGHTVAAALDPGGVYAVSTSGDATAELAWIVAARGEVTDATGVALVRELSPGSHALTAWLPPRAGQPGRVAHGKVVVVAGDVVDLTLALP